MKNKLRLLGIIALVAVIGFAMMGCDNDGCVVDDCEFSRTGATAVTIQGCGFSSCRVERIRDDFEDFILSGDPSVSTEAWLDEHGPAVNSSITCNC